MDAHVVDFYRRIYADLKIDSAEAQELKDFLTDLNPPPDKIIWMRSTAFRIATAFVSKDGGDEGQASNVALLRTVNYIVHAIETNCLQPKDPSLNAQPVDTDVYTEFYKSLYEDLSIDREESEALYNFFKKTNPPDLATLTKARFLAIKVGCDYVTGEASSDVNLFRCINSVVHAFEMSCLQPKPFVLKKSDDVDMGSMDISEAVQHLWKLDVNRLDPTRDYTINVQGGKKPYWKGDQADDPFFSYVDPAAFRRPTYKTFIALLDNYEPQTGATEKVTRAEQHEMDAFLTAVMQTKPMQFCHKYCKHKKPSEIPSSLQDFKKLLYKIWFELYRRESYNDSSGFEHVFVGEIKNDKISGFHNWIHFYLEEKAGRLDYKGYIKPRNKNEVLADEYDQLLTMQFTWHGIEKSVGSSFIGVSPEFELAVYTMCFLVGEEKNQIHLAMGGVENDTFDLNIVCYRMARDKVGTSFPEITDHYED